MQPPAGSAGARDDRPRAESSFGQWARGTTAALGRVIQTTDRLVDAKTGLVPDEAGGEFEQLRAIKESEAERLYLEIRTTVHNAAALVATKRSMAELLREAAANGGDDALVVVLQINPELIYIDKVDARIREKIETRDVRFLRRLTRGLGLKPRLRTNSIVGLIMATLWWSGLKSLTYRETRGFLLEAGLPDVPTAWALERLTQRLELKKYHIE